MEVMLWGLPVVATNTGDTQSLVGNGIAGLICEVFQFGPLAESLRTFVLDFDKRVACGRNGFNKIKEDYSFGTFKDKYIQFIKSLE
jgi:glycosyltransferase involved in cell wall biosynthesis